MLNLYDFLFSVNLDFDSLSVLNNYLNSNLPEKGIFVAEITNFVGRILLRCATYLSKDDVKATILDLVSKFDFNEYLKYHASTDLNTRHYKLPLSIAFKAAAKYLFGEDVVIGFNHKKLTYEEFKSLNITLNFDVGPSFPTKELVSDVHVAGEKYYFVFPYDRSFSKYDHYEYTFIAQKLLGVKSVSLIYNSGFIIVSSDTPKLEIPENFVVTEEDFKKSKDYVLLYNSLVTLPIPKNLDFENFKAGVSDFIKIIKKHKIIIS